MSIVMISNLVNFLIVFSSSSGDEVYQLNRYNSQSAAQHCDWNWLLMVSKRFKFSSTKPFPFFRVFDEIPRRLPQESRNFSERWNDHKYEMSRTFLNPNPGTRFLLRKLAKKIIIVHSSQEMPSILSIIITQDSMFKVDKADLDAHFFLERFLLFPSSFGNQSPAQCMPTITSFI